MLNKENFLKIFKESFSDQKIVRNLYCGSEIPKNKLQKAISSYTTDWKGDDEVLMIFDNSAFGAGGSGFILTTGKLYAEGSPINYELDINEIKSVELKSSLITFNGGYATYLSVLGKEDRIKLVNFFNLLVKFLDNSKKQISSRDNSSKIFEIEDNNTIKLMTVKESENDEKNDINLWLTSEFKIIERFTKLLAIKFNKDKVDHSLFIFGAYLASMNDELDCITLFNGCMRDVINSMTAQGINLGDVIHLETSEIDDILILNKNIKIKLSDDFKTFLGQYKYSTIYNFVNILLDKKPDPTNSNIPKRSKIKSNIVIMNEYLKTIGATKDLFEDNEDAGSLSSQKIGIKINGDVWIFKLSCSSAIGTENSIITLNFKLKNAFIVGSTQHFYIATLGARINNKLRVGGFWLDMDEGDLSYSAGFFVTPNGLNIESIQDNYDYCMNVIKNYAAILKSFILSSTKDNEVGNYEEALEELAQLD